MFEYFPDNYNWSLAVSLAIAMGGEISEIAGRTPGEFLRGRDCLCGIRKGELCSPVVIIGRQP